MTAIERRCGQIRLPGRPDASQWHGSVHAGTTSAISDRDDGPATLALVPDKTEVPTAERKLNLSADPSAPRTHQQRAASAPHTHRL